MSRNNISTNNSSLLAFFVMSLCLVNVANAHVECVDVTMSLMPCQGFLMNRETSPSVACCTGAQSLDRQFGSSDKPDRQAVCTCLKNAGKKIHINHDKAAMLPALCKLVIIRFDPKIDCSKVGKTSGISSND
ncbi:hypothetical protein BC332_15740 [Capsicum chinense]|nr:hypothetical protein BC332_15740 [Capsicum chinense]